jgi:chemotaxis protein methyltransferase CheR
MEKETFEAFQEIAYKKAGIFLRPGKAALVQARLARRLRDLGLASEREYLDRLRVEGEDEVVLFLDAISTNFTRFFREEDHFETLADDVRALAASGQERFRFWCAGCSSGEEPYTLAMVVDPLLRGRDWRILATDISTRVLTRAARGTYGEEELEPVPKSLRRQYLEPAGADEGGPRWTVTARLRERIVFHRLNLADRPYPMKGPLDAVFCRNVMIYFDRAMRAGLVGEVERLLRPGCHFFIGHSETLSGIESHLRSVRPSVYRLPAGGSAR